MLSTLSLDIRRRLKVEFLFFCHSIPFCNVYVQRFIVFDSKITQKLFRNHAFTLVSFTEHRMYATFRTRIAYAYDGKRENLHYVRMRSAV